VIRWPAPASPPPGCGLQRPHAKFQAPPGGAQLHCIRIEHVQRDDIDSRGDWGTEFDDQIAGTAAVIAKAIGADVRPVARR